MKTYKVEALIYYTKLTLDKEHIIKSSTADIQKKLDHGIEQRLTLGVIAGNRIRCRQ